MKHLMIGVGLVQIPLLFAAARLDGWPMLVVALLMMMAIFGQIPLNDGIVGKYVADEYRARVLSVRYVVSLGVASIAVPMIAVLHRTEGGFRNVFTVLAILACAVFVSALFFPRGRRSGNRSRLLRRPDQSFPAGKGEIVPAAGAAEHGDADPLRDRVAHLREARARDEERDAHLRALDHHLGSEPSGGVEDLVRAVDAVQPHEAGDGVDRVVAADVLDEHQDFPAGGGERAAVHRAGLLVDRLVLAHLLDQDEKVLVLQRNILPEDDLLDLFHQVAEHRPLAAAGGDRALADLVVDIRLPAENDGGRIGFPVDLDGGNIVDRIDQPLVAQVAQHQGLGRGGPASSA